MTPPDTGTAGSWLAAADLADWLTGTDLSDPPRPSGPFDVLRYLDERHFAALLATAGEVWAGQQDVENMSVLQHEAARYAWSLIKVPPTWRPMVEPFDLARFPDLTRESAFMVVALAVIGAVGDGSTVLPGPLRDELDEVGKLARAIHLASLGEDPRQLRGERAVSP